MTEKRIIKIIGQNNWDFFCKWMRSQTVGIDENGQINYYEQDVLAFKRKLKTGYDRQEDPAVFD